MLRKRNACTAMDRVLRESVPIMNFFESSQIPLQKVSYRLGIVSEKLIIHNLTRSLTVYGQVSPTTKAILLYNSGSFTPEIDDKHAFQGLYVAYLKMHSSLSSIRVRSFSFE